MSVGVGVRRGRFVVNAVTAAAAVALLCGACSGTSTNTAATGGAGSSTTTGTAGASAGTTVGTAPSGATPPNEIPDRFKGANSAMYADDANWLCRPDLAVDHCTSDPIDSTIIRPDGSTVVEPRAVATNPKVDCFYVYPTVNLAPGGGNKMDLTDLGLELVVTDQQAARFADVCTLYVPLYRQMNLSAYSAPEPEQATAEALAYGDVRDSFAYYMGHFNQGRPIVLIGHSQGTGHLAHLIKDEFDRDDVMRSKLVSALLIGGDVTVAEGKDVGGSFDSIPLCRSSAQRGCVVAYNSFGTNPPPGEDDFFGRSEDGLVSACTNPAALAGGKGMLKPYVPPSPETGKAAAVETNFVQLPDAIEAECRTEAGQTYLAVTAATRPGDKREVTMAVSNVPGWGLHLTEVNLTMGNLLDIVRAQTATLG